MVEDHDWAVNPSRVCAQEAGARAIVALKSMGYSSDTFDP
jgi:hypothetical protein